MQNEDIETHPVQVHTRPGQGNPQIPKAVALRAYNVYSAVYGPQEAMITGGCRGGFSTMEIIAFLYAHTFPREQWQMRVEEAIRGKINV